MVRWQRGLGVACLLALCFLGACARIADRPVEGWPQLAIVEHLVPEKEMRERCLKFPIFGSAPMGCAQFNLQESRCDIWYSTRGPLRSFVLAHERQHCEGYDHAGAHHLEEVLKTYRAKQASR